MLQTIADRITARSGSSTKLARKHLLQQLSVSLHVDKQCLYDLKILHGLYRVEDSDFPTVVIKFIVF